MNTDDYSRNDVQIGHTYFLRKAEGDDAKEQMKNRFLYQVIPVVREYYNDGILMDDVYGVEPNAFENECLEIIRKMISISDMGELEAIYERLLSKLTVPEITQGIKATLLDKRIMVE